MKREMEYIKAGLRVGFTGVSPIDCTGLQCEANLRAGCNKEQCPAFGTNWVCPPGSGTLEECAQRVATCKVGLVLQSIAPMPAGFDEGKIKELTLAHNHRLRALAEEVRQDYTQTLLLTTGGCAICKVCAYPKPCRHPDLRMHSLSAHGIDVAALCKKAHLTYDFTPEKLILVAAILV